MQSFANSNTPPNGLHVGLDEDSHPTIPQSITCQTASSKINQQLQAAFFRPKRRSEMYPIQSAKSSRRTSTCTLPRRLTPTL
jgi:hypothetical protein